MSQCIWKVEGALVLKACAESRFRQRVILQADASDRGIGAVLSQMEDGQEHPVGNFSKKLLPREERYSTVEKECLPLRLAVEAFRAYLFGRPFVIQTDFRSLEWLETEGNQPKVVQVESGIATLLF